MPCRVCDYMLVEAERRQLVFARRGLLRSGSGRSRLAGCEGAHGILDKTSGIYVCVGSACRVVCVNICL